MPSLPKKATAILAVYNGEAIIRACLDSLMNQTIPLEIIVIDDGSTDATTSILQSMEVRLLRQSHVGPAKARNLGAEHANSDILLFVDADMVFDKKYAEELIKPIQIGKAIGTYTTNEQVMNWDNVWARCWNYQEGWESKKRFPQNPPKWGTDFRAIKKEDFMRVGGFDHIGYTDTWSLFHKLQVRPLATQALCYHKNPGSLRAVYVQARWSAKRPYKFGTLGICYALLRTSFPISLIAGIYKSVTNKDPSFVVFKFVYDFGRFVGILEMLSTGKLTK